MLIKHGLPAATTVAVIRHGMTPRQHVIEATLADVVERIAEINACETGLQIVGAVVRLRGKLDWFGPA